MKLEIKHTGYIKQKFNKIYFETQLINLINWTGEQYFKDKYLCINQKDFIYYSNPKNNDINYTNFEIKKKSGGIRRINSPVSPLKSILKSLNIIFQSIYTPHPSSYGFINNKSTVDNAKIHVGYNYVFNIDLKDFFHSFDRNRVKLALMDNPFNLKKEKEPIAYRLACLCTLKFEYSNENKFLLPQGSPTSPTLSNIICRKLDRRLFGLSKRFNLNYTRYADDITFSSDHNIYRDNIFLKELNRIITEDNLYKYNDKKIIIGPQLNINSKKTRLQKSQYRQEVTGLTVNEKVNVPRRYIKQIRMWLYYWERYGSNKASLLFHKDYKKDKGHVKNLQNSFIRVLNGKLMYVKMVKGHQNPTYLKLKNRFDKLLFNHILDVLNQTWEQKGLEESLAMFYRMSKSLKLKDALWYNSKIRDKWDFIDIFLKNIKDKKPSYYKKTIEMIEKEVNFEKNTNKQLPHKAVKVLEQISTSTL